MGSSLKARWYNERGTKLAQRGRLKRAEAAFSVALRYDSRFAASLNNRGFVRLRLGQHELAEADFRAAFVSDPQFALPHHNLGLLQANRGGNTRALHWWRHGVGRVV